MASEVDICNIALGYVGDAAQVNAISPPDGSPQATHCARFYPVSRNSALERHTWGFATRRVALALTDIQSNQWQYVYQGPSQALNYLRVMDPNSPDDFSAPLLLAGQFPVAANSQVGVYTPQPFVVESDETGRDLIYTNVEDALLAYTALVTDTTTFSPLFIEAVAVNLASKLAGPIVKGEEGRKLAMELRAEYESALMKATTSDANQRRVQIALSSPWIVNR